MGHVARQMQHLARAHYDLLGAIVPHQEPQRTLFPDRVLDYRFVVLSHNTIRGAAGAAGAAVLNAELLLAKGYLGT